MRGIFFSFESNGRIALKKKKKNSRLRVLLLSFLIQNSKRRPMSRVLVLTRSKSLRLSRSLLSTDWQRRRTLSFGHQSEEASENDFGESEELESALSSAPYKQIRHAALTGAADDAFGLYRNWLEHGEQAEERRDANSAMLGVLVVSVARAAEATSVKSFFQKESNRIWLHDRLSEVEELVCGFDVALPWRTMRALLSLETALYQFRRGFNGSDVATRSFVPHELGDRELTEVDALIGRVDEFKQAVMLQHEMGLSDLLRDSNRPCVEMMFLAQAKGEGLGAVLQCYEARLAHVDYASDKLNAALLRLAKAEVNEAIGAWGLSNDPGTLRSKMPKRLVNNVHRVLALVPTMRNMDSNMLRWSLHCAHALNRVALVALALDALDRVSDAVDNRLISSMLNACLRFAPNNSVATVDRLWHIHHSSSSSAAPSSAKLTPTPAIVGMSMKVYRRAGAIDKLIDVYEQSINEFGVQVDARNVVVLMHGVVDDRVCTPSAEQQRRALALAEHSGFIDHKYVRGHVRRLPDSIKPQSATPHRAARRRRPTKKASP
jgi:hypothetical protein